MHRPPPGERLAITSANELPKELVPPPADWDRPFRVLADECRIEIGYREAFDTLLRFWLAL
jgi:hypothetical protein